MEIVPDSKDSEVTGGTEAAIPAEPTAENRAGTAAPCPAPSQETDALAYGLMEGSPCSPPVVEERELALEANGGPSDSGVVQVSGDCLPHGPVVTQLLPPPPPSTSQRRSGWDVGPPAGQDPQEATEVDRKPLPDTASARESASERDQLPYHSEPSRKYSSSKDARRSKSPRREKGKSSKRYSRSRSRSPKRVRKHSPRRRSRSPKRSRTRSKSRSRSPTRKRSYSPPAPNVFPLRERRPAATAPYWLNSARLQPGVKEYFESLYERGVLRHDDLDAACVDYLKILPSPGAMQVLQEFARLDYYRIRNLTAFFIGICRRVAAHEPPPPGRGIPGSRGREASPPPPSYRAFPRRSPSRHTPESPMSDRGLKQDMSLANPNLSKPLVIGLKQEQHEHDVMAQGSYSVAWLKQESLPLSSTSLPKSVVLSIKQEQSEHDRLCPAGYSVGLQEHSLLSSSLLDPRLSAQTQDAMALSCLEPAAEPCTPASPSQPAVTTLTSAYGLAAGGVQSKIPPHISTSLKAGDPRAQLVNSSSDIYAAEHLFSRSELPYVSSASGAAAPSGAGRQSREHGGLSISVADLGAVPVDWGQATPQLTPLSLSHSSHNRMGMETRLMDPRLSQNIPPPPGTSSSLNGYGSYSSKAYGVSHVGSIPVQALSTSSQLSSGVAHMNGLHGLNGTGLSGSGSFGFQMHDLIDRDHIAKMHSAPPGLNGGYSDGFGAELGADLPQGYALLRQAVTEYVKEIMKPAWKAQKLSREAFKTIAKKAVDKVLTTQGTTNFPDNADGVVAFMTELRKEKIRKLVQQYLEKYEQLPA